MSSRARTLRLHCLRHDVVEAHGRGSSTLLSGVLFALLAASIVAGISDGRAALQFALLGLFALVDALGDVGTAFLDRRDLPLLRTLPIPPREYVRARLAALALPVGVKTLALGLPPAAALLADGGGVRAAAAFLVAFALMNVSFSALAVLALLLLRRLRRGRETQVAMAWLRALLLVSATAGWLLLLRRPPDEAAGDGGRRLFESAALPSTWFAELAAALGGSGAIRWGLVGLALALVAATAIGLAALAANYVELLEGIESSTRPRSPRRPLWRRWFERAFVAPAERPAFRLGLALLRRERTFRLQTLPLLAYPLLFLWLGRGKDDGGLFALLFAQLPALVLALACLFLRFSDSPAGGFTLRFFARDRAREIESGGRKALWYAVALPLALVVGGLLAWDRGPLFGACVGSVGLLSSTFAVLSMRSRSPELPFVERFGGRIDGGEGGHTFGLLFVVIAAAALEWPLVRAGAQPQAALAAAALVATAWLVRRSPRQGLGFEPETSPPEVVEVASDASAPFAVRLRRELRGLAVFFALAGLVLTAFFAWI